MIPAVLSIAAVTILDLQASNRGYDLNVQVVEALEGGPVILDATLTSRRDRVVTLSRTTRSASRCRAPESWLNLLQFQCGGTERRPIDLEPGESLTERHLLHVDFASKFPAGKHSITVFWPLRIPQTGELRALPFKTVEVTILPATPKNLAEFEHRLNMALDSIPADDNLVPRLRDLYDRVVQTPHKSLVPFELKLLDKYLVVGNGGGLVETIFRAEPKQAHDIFINRLLAKNQSGYPAVVFDVWSSARFESQLIVDRERWSQILTGYLMNWNPPWLLNDIARLIGTSCYDAPRRLLPDDGLNRLSQAEDFWIRILTFANFADRLDKDWQETLLRDVAARRPVATLDRRSELCLWTISDLKPGGARLLDAFAAGPETDAITQFARKCISYRSTDR
jgi:hypothetical protein